MIGGIAYRGTVEIRSIRAEEGDSVISDLLDCASIAVLILGAIVILGALTYVVLA